MYMAGDRVRCIKEISTYDGVIKVGDEGVVAPEEEFNEWDVAIIWDRDVGGHDLGDRCQPGHGWWTDKDDIAIAKPCPEITPPSDVAALFV